MTGWSIEGDGAELVYLDGRRLPDEQAEFDEILAVLGEAMGARVRDAAMAKGAELGVEEAVGFAVRSA